MFAEWFSWMVIMCQIDQAGRPWSDDTLKTLTGRPRPYNQISVCAARWRGQSNYLDNPELFLPKTA